jgi:hypothetical protein
MINAVIIGATGGIIPSDSAWFRNIDPLHLLNLTGSLFVTFLPLFFAVNLYTILLQYLYKERNHSLTESIVRLVFAVIFVLLPLYATVFVYILSGFFIGWWAIVVVNSGIVAGFLVLYQFCSFVFFAEKPKQYFRDNLANPRIWSAAIIFIGILLFPILMLVNPLHKGYFRYFPTHEIFLLTLPDLVMRASIIGIVLLVVQYGLFHYTREYTHQRNTMSHHEEASISST